jgi:type I restriction enzyme S subunit
MTHILTSLQTLIPNTNFADLPLFDRTGWKRMAFGAFAHNIGTRAEPKDAQDDRYVGLEHIDPQSLHIRRWGKGSDVIGTKLRFQKGDIIFGKRRAYQRKLAVADFDGICSAHAMVIRANPAHVLPDFLPFLMMSDRFMNRAVEISVGSLSPTINWNTLKLEEFDLPPLDQQRRIAEILWALKQSEDALISLEEHIKTAKISSACDLFCIESPTLGSFNYDKIDKSNYALSMLGDLCKIVTGGTPKTSVAEYWDGTIKWMASGDVHLKEIFDVPGRITESGLKNSNTRMLPKNAVVIALAGQGKTRGTVAILRTELSCNQSVAAFIADETKLLPDILYNFLDIQYQALRMLTGDENRTGLNLKILRDIKIALPTIEEQQLILNTLSTYNSLLYAISAKKKSNEILLTKLLASLVEGN